MDVDQCIETYNKMCEEIFAESSYNFKLSKTKGLKVKGSFDHTVLEECISETIAEHSASCQDSTQARKIPLNDSSEHSDHTKGFQCKVFVYCLTWAQADADSVKFCMCYEESCGSYHGSVQKL